MCYSVGLESPTAYVFKNEDEMDAFTDVVSGKSDDHDYTILFTLCSGLKASAFLKKEYADAKVVSFKAVGEDRFAICIEPAY